MQVLVPFSYHSNITDLFCRSCCDILLVFSQATFTQINIISTTMQFYVLLVLLLNLSDPFVTSPHHLLMLPPRVKWHVTDLKSPTIAMS